MLYIYICVYIHPPSDACGLGVQLHGLFQNMFTHGARCNYVCVPQISSQAPGAGRVVRWPTKRAGCPRQLRGEKDRDHALQVY